MPSKSTRPPSSTVALSTKPDRTARNEARCSGARSVGSSGMIRRSGRPRGSTTPFGEPVRRHQQRRDPGRVRRLDDHRHALGARCCEWHPVENHPGPGAGHHPGDRHLGRRPGAHDGAEGSSHDRVAELSDDVATRPLHDARPGPGASSLGSLAFNHQEIVAKQSAKG